MISFYRRLLIALISLWWSMASIAEDVAPFVEISVSPQQVMVGESLRLEVIVMVPTWFDGTPVFPSFELTNSITRLPPDSSYPTSRRIKGETWSGIVRHYEVTPLIAANFELDNRVIKVGWADPGKPPLSADVPVPTITYRGTVPAGAENLVPFVAGRSLTLERHLSETESLKPGDAVVIETTATLDGLPGFFIPDLLTAHQMPGARVYPAEPVVEEKRRKETVTLVLDRSGQVTIPGVTIRWWNTEEEKIQTSALAPITLLVADATADPEMPSMNLQWHWLVTLAIALPVIGFALHYALKYVLKYVRQKLEPDEETLAYRKVTRSIQARDAEATYKNLLVWSRTATGLDPTETFQREDQPVLETLKKHVFRDREESVSFHELQQALDKIRHKANQSVASGNITLPPLNP